MPSPSRGRTSRARPSPPPSASPSAQGTEADRLRADVNDLLLAAMDDVASRRLAELARSLLPAAPPGRMGPTTSWPWAMPGPWPPCWRCSPPSGSGTTALDRLVRARPAAPTAEEAAALAALQRSRLELLRVKAPSAEGVARLRDLLFGAVVAVLDDTLGPHTVRVAVPDRCVIVHVGAHGTDNGVTLGALDRHPDRLRGVAVVPASLPRAMLEDMHRCGMRGCRLSTVVSGGAGFDRMRGLSRDTAELGWHLVLHFGRSEELVDVEPLLRELQNPFVLDHVARITATEGTNSPAFAAMLRLLDTDRCRVKLASLYRLSAEPYPHRDLLPMISEAVRRRPDRLLWGSGWPHPICPGGGGDAG